jgi:thiamine biosynthesis lipoprotein
MSRRAVVVVVSGAVLLAAVFVYRAWQVGTAEPAYVRYDEWIMAAPIEVLVPEDGGAEAAELVFDVFRQVDERMSEWKPTSPLSAVNEAAGSEAVAVPDDLRAVIRRGLEIGELTDGAFDVTWAALWGLWDFTAEDPQVPADEAIERRVAMIDFRQVEIDDRAGTVYLPRPGMTLGLGAIAKGHALDRSAQMLRAASVDSFLISAAGQMMVGGTRGGRPWRVGIRDPRGEVQDFFARLEVIDTSVSTSGDYERHFELDGIRYHHILDPRTGRPTRGVRSATVVCPDATLADALSTSLMILGVERSLALVEKLDGVEAVLVVDADGQVHTSRGLQGAVELLHDPRE